MTERETRSVRPSGTLPKWELDDLHRRIRNELAWGPISNNEVARRVGCAAKTVARFRKSRNLPNFYGRMPSR